MDEAIDLGPIKTHINTPLIISISSTLLILLIVIAIVTFYILCIKKNIKFNISLIDLLN